MKQDKIQEAYDKMLNEGILGDAEYAADNARDALQIVIKYAKSIKDKKAIKNLEKIYSKMDEEFNFIDL